MKDQTQLAISVFNELLLSNQVLPVGLGLESSKDVEAAHVRFNEEARRTGHFAIF